MTFKRDTCPAPGHQAACLDHARSRKPVRARGALGALGLACLLLAGCATSGATTPSVTRLSTKSYAPTQTVDVLGAVPQQPFVRIAQLKLTDATGSATRSQLIAQLTSTARSLGANALVVAPEQQSGNSSIGFNPSGGQMQGSSDQAALTVTALAIRYTH